MTTPAKEARLNSRVFLKEGIVLSEQGVQAEVVLVVEVGLDVGGRHLPMHLTQAPRGHELHHLNAEVSDHPLCEHGQHKAGADGNLFLVGGRRGAGGWLLLLLLLLVVEEGHGLAHCSLSILYCHAPQQPGELRVALHVCKHLLGIQLKFIVRKLHE